MSSTLSVVLINKDKEHEKDCQELKLKDFVPQGQREGLGS